jgi:uncharacterized protein (DUF58 family)
MPNNLNSRLRLSQINTGFLVEQLAVVRTEAPEADHIRAAATLLSLQKQHGLVIWITDLAETAMTPEVIDAADRLLARHLLIFIVIAQRR